MNLHKIWVEFRVILFAVLVAIFLRTFAYEPFRIPSGSMIPTLVIGDFLFVSKMSYGYSRFSLPFDLPLIGGRVMAEMPQRGDVVVFSLPSDPSIIYIKRMVGLPGDTIQLRDSTLYVNGDPVEYTQIEDYVAQNRNGGLEREKQFLEVLPGGKVHNTLEHTLTNAHLDDNTPVYRVPEGHFFGMGDNRDNSLDSRFANGVGFIPFENLIGRAEFIFFSIDGDAWKIWQWPWSLRFSRFFQGIE